MAIKLLWQVMDSHLYPKHPRCKIMLMSLANFADEFGKGKMWNGSTARHIGTGEEQVRRYKRMLEEHGLVSFTYRRGKGRQTNYQIDLVALDIEINQTGRYDEGGSNVTPPTDPNMTPPAGGVNGNVTPPLNEVTPLLEGKNPTSRSGVIRETKDKKACARGTHDTDIGRLAAYWRKTLIHSCGEEWVNSWLVEEQIIEGPDGVVLFVRNAFGKASVERRLETLSGASAVSVVVHQQAVRASA